MEKVMLNKCDLILSRGQIEVLGEISSSGFIFAFDNIRDHAGILKILTDANPNVYQFLMHHPHMNLCTVYDYWKEGDQLFVFEEYINGQTLDERFREGGVSESEAVSYLCQICDGVNVLHSADPPIIHKDLKMENVMVDQNGIVKIIDFDISRVYRLGAVRDTRRIGTVGYASPEHFGFGQTNGRSDQYAIGQMMGEMGLTYGRFARIRAKATQIDPKYRYRDILSLKRDLMKERFSFFPIPGFRSHTLWKELVSLLAYAFLISFWMTIEIKNVNSALEMQVYRISMLLMSLTEVGLFTKWAPIYERIPFLQHPNRLIRILAYAVTAVMVVAIWILILVVAVYIVMET